MKSAELTGLWEKKLREIEKRTYDASRFLEELKQMVTEIVTSVLSDNTNRRITIISPVDAEEKSKSSKRDKASNDKDGVATKVKRTPRSRKKVDTSAAVNTEASKEVAAKLELTVPVNPAIDAQSLVGQPCPLCGKGVIIKGKTAYGCSEWRNGCTFREPFETV